MSSVIWSCKRVILPQPELELLRSTRTSYLQVLRCLSSFCRKCADDLTRTRDRCSLSWRFLSQIVGLYVLYGSCALAGGKFICAIYVIKVAAIIICTTLHPGFKLHKMDGLSDVFGPVRIWGVLCRRSPQLTSTSSALPYNHLSLRILSGGSGGVSSSI